MRVANWAQVPNRTAAIAFSRARQALATHWTATVPAMLAARHDRGTSQRTPRD